MHRVDADAVGREVDGRGLRQPAHGPLARHVGGRLGRALEARDRRDVHDRAAAGARERGGDGLHAEHRPGHVDVHHAAEVVELELGEVGEVDDARVVDEHVDAAELGLGLGDELAPRRLVDDVEVPVARGVADLLGDLLALDVEHVGEHDARALGREGPRLGLALPARGAADHDDLALEAIRHARSRSPKRSTVETPSRICARKPSSFASARLAGRRDLVDAVARQHDHAVGVGHDDVAGRDRHAGHGDGNAHVAGVVLDGAPHGDPAAPRGKADLREAVDVADAAVDDEPADAAHLRGHREDLAPVAAREPAGVGHEHVARRRAARRRGAARGCPRRRCAAGRPCRRRARRATPAAAPRRGCSRCRRPRTASRCRARAAARRRPDRARSSSRVSAGRGSRASRAPRRSSRRRAPRSRSPARAPRSRARCRSPRRRRRPRSRPRRRRRRRAGRPA